MNWNWKFTWLALAGLGAVALAGAPTAAYAQNGDVDTSVSLTKFYDENVDVDYDNTVNVNINKEVDVEKDVDFTGVVVINGTVNVSEAALSLIDNKQIIDDNVGFGASEDGALVNNTIVDGTVLQGAAGNVGLNVAVGDNILQENAGALAAIGVGPAGGVTASSSDAETFSVQKSINNGFASGGEGGVSEITNTLQVLGDVLGGASGNAGVNVAAGAYLAQKNALALAAVTGTATLSEATAAVLQESTFNNTFHNDTLNDVKLGDAVAAGFTGNIGINLAAGTNNLQQNSLAISSVTP